MPIQQKAKEDKCRALLSMMSLYLNFGRLLNKMQYVRYKFYTRHFS